MSEDYYYLSESEFTSLLEEFNKIVFVNGSAVYEDTFIKVYRPLRIITDYKNEIQYDYSKSIYRVDRKRFEFSKNELLRKYPNIVYSAGKYPNYDAFDVIRYSKEVGYIIPHILQLVYDESYRKYEKAMYVISN